MQELDYVQPTSVAAVLDEIADSDGQDVLLFGGGTALTQLLKQRLISPRRLVSLWEVPGLCGITTTESGLRLGAGVRLREIEESRLLRETLPSLAEAAGSVGNVRVRNVAMLGGHLAHADPAQDLPPLLLALDATVCLESRHGQRTLTLTDFLVDYMTTALEPHELLLSVLVPHTAMKRRTQYHKYSPRSLDDYGTIGVAASVELTNDGTCTAARLALGGVGATAIRLLEVEEYLTGHLLTPERCQMAGRMAAAQVDPWDDLRGCTDYKRAMCGVWTERVLVSLMNGKR